MEFMKVFRKFLTIRDVENIDDIMADFESYVNGRYTKDVIADSIVDFLDVLCDSPTRWQSFAKYIGKEFPKEQYKRVLDVGCGPLADLSLVLTNMGYETTGIDPRVHEKGRIKLIRRAFDYLKTDVSNFDLIVGLEPCDATEHIVRSSLKNNVPSAISLCAAPHNGIDGRSFGTTNEWYDFLLSLSNSRGQLKEVVSDKTHMILKIK